MGHLPGAVVGISVGVIVTIQLSVLILAIVVDRNRIRRQAAVAVAAKRAQLHRRHPVDDLFREIGTGLPALAGSLACQLRSPLADMSAEAESLHREAPHLFDEHRVLLENVRAGIRRLQEATEALLEYATADSIPLSLTDVDLTALAAFVVADRCALSIGPVPRVLVSPLPTVRGDAALLRQALDNLVRNAIEHAIPGRPAQVTIAAAQVGPSAWRIEVMDRGVGITTTNRAHPFAAFRRGRDDRRSSSGTGLGLAVVERVVQRHGGSTGADAVPGGGARFWFTLSAGGPVDQW
ncbi:hypothetical protein Q0Z83_021870 [Actinoplanes sichuanensis]|uniref:Sensor-like histidine kinase SenX3 n=1 Tax=Actinoplanes sichuanensis TaxID=512349 RepID=A0ABW4AK27_9ACTN|nr:HAMP domain-containing sensor histidine kinase [Actinoplanes sichuanensis]BEL03996.1 hypothetical protein Q0Z83_021870 [Actinoplanes sichuanensis]